MITVKDKNGVETDLNIDHILGFQAVDETYSAVFTSNPQLPKIVVLAQLKDLRRKVMMARKERFELENEV